MKYELDLMDARREGQREGEDRQEEKDITLMVRLLRNKQIKDETIMQDLMHSFELSPEKAKHYLKKSGK